MRSAGLEILWLLPLIGPRGALEDRRPIPVGKHRLVERVALRSVGRPLRGHRLAELVAGLLALTVFGAGIKTHPGVAGAVDEDRGPVAESPATGDIDREHGGDPARLAPFVGGERPWRRAVGHLHALAAGVGVERDPRLRPQYLFHQPGVGEVPPALQRIEFLAGAGDVDRVGRLADPAHRRHLDLIGTVAADHGPILNQGHLRAAAGRAQGGAHARRPSSHDDDIECSRIGDL